MRVYKFLSAKWGLEAINRKRIKISRFHELNDPFDCHAVRFETATEREAWQRAIIGLGRNRALTCFSTHFHNPLLWSHYAENHCGMVLGFDVDDSISFLKVNYATTFLDGRGFLTFPEDKKLLILKRALSRKSLQWKYESEVRAFVDLDHDSPENGHYFLNFDAHFKLSEVIVGPRSTSQLEDVESACHAINARLVTAWLSSIKYEVVCT